MSKLSTRAEAALWLRQMTPGLRGRTKPGLTPPDPLRAAGELLRDARQAKGLSLRDLAQRTRISIAVLEALEGGWKDRLPEATYLRAMLPLLEHHLDLPAGSLEPVLPHAGGRARGSGGGAGQQVVPLSASTVHLLSSWQSALVYGLLVVGLLYGVNLQQQRLAAMGRLAVSPIPLAPAQPITLERPTDAFPDIHPLRKAAKGNAMELLAKETKQSAADLSLGLLTLRLNQPTKVDLRSSRSGDSQLVNLEGELSLPVLPPFELRLTPAPPPAAVRWKGQTLQEKGPSLSQKRHEDGPNTAVYAVPAASPPPKTP